MVATAVARAMEVALGVVVVIRQPRQSAAAAVTATAAASQAPPARLAAAPAARTAAASSTAVDTVVVRIAIPCTRAVTARPAYCQRLPRMYFPSCAWRQLPAQRGC